jgi:hypothetical protein
VSSSDGWWVLVRSWLKKPVNKLTDLCNTNIQVILDKDTCISTEICCTSDPGYQRKRLLFHRWMWFNIVRIGSRSG